MHWIFKWEENNTVYRTTRKNVTKKWGPAASFIRLPCGLFSSWTARIKRGRVRCQGLNKLPFSQSDACFVRIGDNFIPHLWAQMRERRVVRVQHMSTFRGTNGMSIKRRHADAFSPVAPAMLSGDAALLFRQYSGCTGNILSFYPSTSPRSSSHPLAINDSFCSPCLPFLRLLLFSTCIASCWVSLTWSLPGLSLFLLCTRNFSWISHSDAAHTLKEPRMRLRRILVLNFHRKERLMSQMWKVTNLLQEKTTTSRLNFRQRNETFQ